MLVRGGIGGEISMSLKISAGAGMECSGRRVLAWSNVALKELGICIEQRGVVIPELLAFQTLSGFCLWEQF